LQCHRSGAGKPVNNRNNHRGRKEIYPGSLSGEGNLSWKEHNKEGNNKLIHPTI